MDNIARHPQSYIPGSLSIKRNVEGSHTGRFTLEGNFQVGDMVNTDHFQLIYEALEIAANSTDKIAPQFRAMCDELMQLTMDWDQ